MFPKHKLPSVEAGILIIIVVISVFSFAFFTENKVTGMAVGNKVTGEMVKVTGMGGKW